MVEHGASDLYITVDSPPMYRIEGAELQPVNAQRAQKRTMINKSNQD